MKNKLTLILLACCFLIFYSCETEGQITGEIIEPPQDTYVDSDLNPEDGEEVGHIGNLYYNLLSDENYNQEFWKFNFFHLNGGNHCGPNSTGCELDVLDLVTFNDSYYIPPEAFTGSGFCEDPEFNNDEGGCCFSGGGNWTGSECDPVGTNDWTPSVIAYIVNPNYDSSNPNSEEYIPYIGDDGFNILEELVTEELVESELVNLSEEIALTTPSLSIPTDPIEKINWSIGENMYTFTIMSPIKDTIFFPYEYEYNLRHNFVPLDTILNPILDDVTIILDPDEIGDELRYYDIFDTLDVETNNSSLPVNIYREHTFYSYMNQLNNDFTQRINTDCNDNYQKDDAELTIDDFESDCNGNWIHNETNLCNSFCSTNNTPMYDLCWNEFIDNERLTGHCTLDNSIGAFCDTGNNLFDNTGEVLYDACFGDCDGENGNIDVIGQGVEPFEDRNCNNSYEEAESEVMFADGSTFQNEDDCLDAMSDFENFYTSWDSHFEICYIDAGNGQWDDVELCYGEAETCNYMNLYEKGFSPNVLVADYSDQNNPIALTNIFGGDVYLDCGSDQLCNEDEFGYDPGTCDDNYSGTEETCCKHNLCWDYSGEGQCDYTLDGCMLPPSGGWQENLDPNGDDSTTERNFQYDPGELLVKDFNDDLSYSAATNFKTKYLHYESCIALNDPAIDDNCGGNLFDVIYDEIEVASVSDNIQKYEAEVDVSSYKVIGQLPIVDDQLNDLNIVKTQWPDADEIDGQSEDYMLFMNSDDYDDNGMHYIIKLIQPYYYYAWSSYTATGDINEFDSDLWWQSLSWDKDTLLYSDSILNNGRIIDGASWHTAYDVPSDTAQYVVHKEYEVSRANAEMTYSPTVENCVLITRTITTTMIGPAVDFKLRSQTYLKEGFPVVKEVISWSWPPNLGGTENLFFDISSMEYKSDVEQNYSNNMFDDVEPIDLQNIQNYEGFNFDPFILSNTIGLQRFIMPPEPGLDE